MLYEGYPDLDALVAIGCVIRGETYHFELVANESSRGVTDFVMTEGISVANCILTVENEEQAKVRVQEKVPTPLASLWKWAIFAASADAALWKITEKIMDSNHTGAKSPAKKRGGRSARRRSREFALQGVYQWLMSIPTRKRLMRRLWKLKILIKPTRLFTVNCFTASLKSFRLLRPATLLTSTASDVIVSDRTSHSFDRYLRTQKHDHSLSRRDQRGSGTG